MTEKILEYAEEVYGGFVCGVYSCEHYWDIEGERTNGMELKAEMNSYYNTFRSMG